MNIQHALPTSDICPRLIHKLQLFKASLPTTKALRFINVACSPTISIYQEKKYIEVVKRVQLISLKELTIRHVWILFCISDVSLNLLQTTQCVSLLKSRIVLFPPRPQFLVQPTLLELRTFLLRHIQLDLRNGELGGLRHNVGHLQAGCPPKFGLEALQR